MVQRSYFSICFVFSCSSEIFGLEWMKYWFLFVIYFHQRTLWIQHVFPACLHVVHLSPVVGKTCFLLPSTEQPSSCDGESKAQMFDRQQEWPVFCHKARNLGERCLNAACVCMHSGEVSFTQLRLELSARSASVWSCVACDRRLPESRTAAWVSDLIKTRWTRSWSTCIPK